MDKRVPPSSSLEQFWSRRNGRKSARELRQGGSDYRCCIPALAGFVSPQSIAPDGKQTFSQESQRATRNSQTFDEKIGAWYAPSQQPARAAVRSSAFRRQSHRARPG